MEEAAYTSQLQNDYENADEEYDYGSLSSFGSNRNRKSEEVSVYQTDNKCSGSEESDSGQESSQVIVQKRYENEQSESDAKIEVKQNQDIKQHYRCEQSEYSENSEVPASQDQTVMTNDEYSHSNVGYLELEVPTDRIIKPSGQVEQSDCDSQYEVPTVQVTDDRTVNTHCGDEQSDFPELPPERTDQQDSHISDSESEEPTDRDVEDETVATIKKVKPEPDIFDSGPKVPTSQTIEDQICIKDEQSLSDNSLESKVSEDSNQDRETGEYRGTSDLVAVEIEPRRNNKKRKVKDVVEPSMQSGENDTSVNEYRETGEYQKFNGTLPKDLVRPTVEIKQPRVNLKRKVKDIGEACKRSKSADASMNKRNSSQTPVAKKVRLAKNQCLFCYKTFRDRYHLIRHQSVHAGETAPDCKQCKKPRNCCGCFPALEPVTLVKQHKCDVCGKLFRDKYHLHRHSSVHTKDKPYQCKICQKHFSRKDKLTQHILVHL